ncbi:DoxX family protein [Weeksellaceae bacterium KMM 9713]|uniref:DoxX family protein n=1 Tax=Profundicola chukchiensis TaxID=2961959 RepID=A0A9X4MYP1_9FLAO|nr:DoxX family protein [Profundicola chukchiensis]MDG4946027.1 DoxX family protein [Profundicola chukchiensis]
MKQNLSRFLNPGLSNESVSIAMLILRLVAGVFMLTHGWGKMEALFSGEPIQFADPIGLGQEVSLVLAVFAEVLCAILLIIGLATRFAVIPLIFTMLVAALIVHADDPLAKQELPTLFAAMFAAVGLIGAGKYSVDYLLSKKSV